MILKLISARMFLCYTDCSAVISVVVLWQLGGIALMDHFRVLCDAVVVYKCLFLKAVWVAALRGGLLLLVENKGVCRF